MRNIREAGTALIVCICLNNFANAGDLFFNGGDVLRCQNSKPTLTDIYEAKTENQFELDLGGPRLALFSKVEMALKRLEKFSPSRAKIYREQALSFFSAAALVDENQMPQSQQDVYSWQLPEDCVLTQLSSETPASNNSAKQYLVKKDIWMLLDDDNKAAFILHEVIFHEAVSLGQVNSVSTRYFNSLLFSHALDLMSEDQFNEILASLRFPDLENIHL